MESMKIVELPLDELRPYDNNPRQNDEAVPFVAESLREFGWQQPIVIDRDNIIVAGHTRYKAALRLGMKTAPCKYADELTEDEVAAYRLADNKTAELATWDDDKPMKCDLHPTMKPIKLIARFMVNSSQKGDPVADIFGGSGSTLIAAEQLNRKCYMMELDPHYCDVIINRWETFTGNKAKVIND